MSPVRARVSSFVTGQDTPLFYFGPLNAEKVEEIRRHYSLVVIEPALATAALVKALKSGPDGELGTQDDVVVLGYFSAGEDSRTLTLRDADLPKGDGSGPRVDPRPGAPFPDGHRDLGVSHVLGIASPGGGGFASYYLDDTKPDGVPDRNRAFGGAFVNAGDPRWFQDSMDFLAKRDRVSGLREILTDSYGNGLGCDGVMLDTFDTPAPNGWTDEKSFNQTEFEWTASGFLAYVQRLRQAFPEKVILINRGVAFFNPELGHYRYNFRGLIDLLLFESFYSDSSPDHLVSPFWKNNRETYAPRINAEADRPWGFKVISLGYKPQTWPHEVQAVSQLGWIMGLANPDINHLQSEVFKTPFPAPRPPSWDSTSPGSGPRVGIQEAIPEHGGVTVRWDVANAMRRPVRYHLYFQAGEFMNFEEAQRIRLHPEAHGPGYEESNGRSAYPYEYHLSCLQRGTYTLAIRAEDAGSPPLEEGNTRSLTVRIP